MNSMRGVQSQAMVLVAHDKDNHEKVEFLQPPEGSEPGDLISFFDEPRKNICPQGSVVDPILRVVWL